MKRSLVLVAALGASLAAGSAWAIPTGTVAVDGVVTFDETSLSWASDTVSGVTGGFSPSLDGTSVTLNPLGFPPLTIGSAFASQNFLDLNGDPSLPQLLIDFIFPGVGGTAQCPLAPTPGQLCNPSGTPYGFENTSGGGNTLTFDLSGVTSDGTADWSGMFTAQFSTPYQTVLDVLAAGGSVFSSYSATITVTGTSSGTPVPEPASLAYFLSALGGLAAVQRWRSRRKNV